jgi:phosphoribosylformylglycinamidine synthase
MVRWYPYPVRFAIVRFPGTWSDRDCRHVLVDVLGEEADILWHRETNLEGYDAVILPGGFSYGDYLRCGAIARFSPVMDAVTRFAERGGPVIGICNGFQVLCEAGLLPGALVRNEGLRFACKHVGLRVETTDSPFTAGYRAGQVLSVPIAHGEGRYTCDAETLARLKADDAILFRYCAADGGVTPDANPNGSVENIAGIVGGPARNVLGMMPHPERACAAALGSTDGLPLFAAVRDALRADQGGVKAAPSSPAVLAAV